MKRKLKLAFIFLIAGLLSACSQADNNSTSNTEEETAFIINTEEKPENANIDIKLNNPQPDEKNTGIVYYEIGEEFKSSNGLYTNYYKFKLPQLTGQSAKAEKMNAAIVNVYKRMIARAYKEVRDNFTNEGEEQSLVQEGESTYGYTDEADYAVTYNTDKYLSIVVDGYSYLGGAHGMPYREVIILNSETGEEVQGEQLFAVSEETFLEKKQKAFEADFKKNPEMYWGDALEIVKSTADSYQKGYYLTDEGVVFYYAPYELAPYAAGFVEVTIPYSEIPLK